MLDAPPGFSRNVLPGFTKAGHRAEANDVSYVDGPPNLVRNPAGSSNNIPPGFTVADLHRPKIISCTVSTPITEKKPLIRFSLNAPRLVKKEPEPPSVDKAIEKLMPSPLASGASSVRKLGKVDGMRITHDEVQNYCPVFLCLTKRYFVF
jgi:hypothetical protein